MVTTDISKVNRLVTKILQADNQVLYWYMYHIRISIQLYEYHCHLGKPSNTFQTPTIATLRHSSRQYTMTMYRDAS